MCISIYVDLQLIKMKFLNEKYKNSCIQFQYHVEIIYYGTRVYPVFRWGTHATNLNRLLTL